MRTERSLNFGLWRVVVLLVSATTSGAQAPGANAAATPDAKSYVVASGVPSSVREMLLVLGDRLQKPGKERVVLTGTFTDRSGARAATLTWQSPGDLRFDSGPGEAVTYAKDAGTVGGSEVETLESLLDDCPENFLFTVASAPAFRFLGPRFRNDDGTTRNYTGPWFDIFEFAAPVQAAGKAVSRQKFFFVDSDTKLLAKVTYAIRRGGAAIQISTEFRSWKRQDGQAYPGQIIRWENGAAIFTFEATRATFTPGVKDGSFAHP